MNKEQTFITQSISTAAALLATEEITFNKIAQSTGFKKEIHLVPKKKAEDFYQKMLSGKLMVNALENSLWVEKLKELIFRTNI